MSKKSEDPAKFVFGTIQKLHLQHIATDWRYSAEQPNRDSNLAVASLLFANMLNRSQEAIDAGKGIIMEIKPNDYTTALCAGENLLTGYDPYYSARRYGEQLMADLLVKLGVIHIDEYHPTSIVALLRLLNGAKETGVDWSNEKAFTFFTKQPGLSVRLNVIPHSDPRNARYANYANNITLTLVNN